MSATLVFSRRSAQAAAVALTLFLSGCSSSDRTIRYRLTLNANTPEGAKSGSSVVQIKVSYNDGILKGLGNVANTTYRGEATVIDLGANRLLFAILADPMMFLISPSLLEMARFNDSGPGFYDALNRLKPKAVIPFAKLPMLVRFRNASDPTSIERVDPNNIAASFGPGVALTGATLEITDAPVTDVIERLLPWLSNGYPEKLIDPSTNGKLVKDIPPERRLVFCNFIERRK